MKEADIFLIKSKYKSLPGFKVAPKGSTTPVFISMSFATALMISGLNCGSENTQATLSCSIISLISANCSAPGITSVNADVKVVASIKPIHSLASSLMDGVGKPDLIVDGYASPHGFAMKPSHAKMLQEADIIFWVGEDLENFLVKPLSSIAKKAEKIELMDIKGLTVLKFRERNIFDDHDHDDHGPVSYTHLTLPTTVIV